METQKTNVPKNHPENQPEESMNQAPRKQHRYGMKSVEKAARKRSERKTTEGRYRGQKDVAVGSSSAGNCRIAERLHCPESKEVETPASSVPGDMAARDDIARICHTPGELPTSWVGSAKILHARTGKFGYRIGYGSDPAVGRVTSFETGIGEEVDFVRRLDDPR
jgi:hypothetical protein